MIANPNFVDVFALGKDETGFGTGDVAYALRCVKANGTGTVLYASKLTFVYEVARFGAVGGVIKVTKPFVVEEVAGVEHTGAVCPIAGVVGHEHI